MQPLVAQIQHVIMNNWEDTTLQEVSSKIGDGLHGTPEYEQEGEYYFINGNNLSNGKIEIKESTQRISYKEYLKYKKPLNNRTILISINGTLGNIALYNGEKCILGKSACYINVLDHVNKNFIKYVLLNRHFQEHIRVYAHGTTIQNVSLKTVREYSFKLPSLVYQENISEILTSLDDKIDLLHRQNKTLEALAETLFRQWFIEEADDKWLKGKLSDVIELIYGKGLKEEIRTGIGYPVIGSSGIVGYHSEYLVETPGIVIGRKGTLGKVIYLFDNFYPIDTTYYVKSKQKTENLMYEYFLLKTLNFEEMNSDSAVPGLNRDIALSSDVKIPPINKIMDFDKLSGLHFNKIKANTNQIRTLTQLRDTLLPKLMSGEVRVEGLNVYNIK